MRKLMCGVGINDADYQLSLSETYYDSEGKRKFRVIWKCPFYTTWTGMIQRCYDKNIHLKYPNYADCRPCEEWLYFSKFKSWMEQQDWEGKHLDKDLLVKGNKTYSPEFCVFVDHRTNSFVIDCGKTRGEWPVGVYFDRGKFNALCRDINSVQRNLGRFTSPEDAHKAWLAFKLEQAKLLASTQVDSRVANALVERYENYHAVLDTTI